MHRSGVRPPGLPRRVRRPADRRRGARRSSPSKDADKRAKLIDAAARAAGVRRLLDAEVVGRAPQQPQDDPGQGHARLPDVAARPHRQEHAASTRWCASCITASGSTFANPPANYYRIARDPHEPGRDDGPALLRHPHAVRQVPQPSVRALDAGRLLQHGRVLRPREAEARTRSSRAATRKTPGAEVIYVDRAGEVTQPRTGKAMAAEVHGRRGRRRSPPGKDRREVLADWLTVARQPVLRQVGRQPHLVPPDGQGHRRSGGRLPRLEPVGQRRTARRPGQGLRRQQVRRQAPDPHDHELADLSAQRPDQRLQQGRQQVFLARRHEAADGRAAARRDLRRDGGAGEVRRPAAGHAGRAAARRRGQPPVPEDVRPAGPRAGLRVRARGRQQPGPGAAAHQRPDGQREAAQRRTTASASCWRKKTADREMLDELYLATLSRPPTTTEVKAVAGARRQGRRTSARRGKTCTGR